VRRIEEHAWKKGVKKEKKQRREEKKRREALILVGSEDASAQGARGDLSRGET